MKQQLNGEKTKISFYLRVTAALCLCVVFLVQSDFITAQGSEANEDVDATLKSVGGGAKINTITLNDQKAKDTLGVALKALGGAGKIGDIKSLIIEGSEKVVSAEYKSTPNKFEILILLPDNFIQVNYLTEGRRSFLHGISKEEMLPPMSLFPLGKMRIEEAEKLKKNPPKPNAEQIAAINTTVKTRSEFWSYFLIGLLAKAGPMPLTLSSGSTPGVFTMTKKDGAAGEVEFDAKTGYPSVVRFKVPRQTVDDELRFNDRFSVDGIMFPRSIDSVSTNILYNTLRQIEKVQINPKLSSEDFQEFVVR